MTTITRFLALATLLLAACSSAASTTPAGDVKDFKLVAYQGDALIGGRETKLSKVFEQGKPVVLNFWAGQCPPCQAEMPGFQKVAQEFEGKVVFVGVDVGPFTGLGSHDDARRLLARLRVTYPAAYAVDDSPLRLYNVRSMPTTVVFAANGRTVQQVGGMLLEPQLRSTLQKLVGTS